MQRTIKNISILLLIILTIVSCAKEKNDVPKAIDIRDSVTGVYNGIEIVSGWTGELGPNFYHDTSPVDMTLSKSPIDSIVIINFSYLNITHDPYTFKYYGNIFISTDLHSPPTLRRSHDSLFFYYHPGLGPLWVDCIVKKIK